MRHTHNARQTRASALRQTPVRTRSPRQPRPQHPTMRAFAAFLAQIAAHPAPDSPPASPASLAAALYTLVCQGPTATSADAFNTAANLLCATLDSDASAPFGPTAHEYADFCAEHASYAGVLTHAAYIAQGAENAARRDAALVAHALLLLSQPLPPAVRAALPAVLECLATGGPAYPTRFTAPTAVQRPDRPQ